MVIVRQKSNNSMDFDYVISEATVREKVQLTAGHDFWHTAPIPRLSVPSIKFSDGPNGVRGSKFFDSVPGVCIPCGSGLGATWNKTLLKALGVLLSQECKVKGAHAWLDPTVNMHRSPLNGRGFESFSEDPFLSGILAAKIIEGVQSGGSAAVLKHFVANDQETEKRSVDVVISDRALREIYLLPFQLALRYGKPDAVMSSYNKVQGMHCSESKNLLRDILRTDWGFDGLIMSDWFGTYSTDAAFAAGLDLEMPGPSLHRSTAALLALSSGKLQMKDVDAAASNVLRFVQKLSRQEVASVERTRNLPEDMSLNRQLATESIVLLKNDSGILPLRPDCGSLALIGPNVKNAAACGGGSASLNPYYTTSAFEGIVSQIVPGTEVKYEAGVYSHFLLPVLNKNNVVNEDGLPGVTIEFFHESYSNRDRVSFDKTTLPEAAYQLMDYKQAQNDETFYISMRGMFIPECSGTYEFGLASFGVSDLYINGELIIDNSTTQEAGGMFFGNGSTESRATFEMEQGKEYLFRMEAGSASTSKLSGGMIDLPGGACRLGACLRLNPEEGIRRAVGVAKSCKNVIVVAGLNGDYEKEGRDRTDMDMPAGYDALISAVLAVQPSTIVVAQAGTPISMPWRSEAQSLIHTWYGGNESGNALADIIFGKANPSGKLPMTFPDRLGNTASFLTFGSDNGKARYDEGIFVGYRYHDAVGRGVAFPFGHGLSYTKFTLRDLKVSSERIEVVVENTGNRAGSETLQLYISRDRKTSVFKRPVKELKGFEKVTLEAKQVMSVTIPIDKYSTAVWDEKRDTWACEKGQYTASVFGGEQCLKGTFELARTAYWNGL
ncbi:related to Probable beta-glucosidase K [Rhynchosporium secalis]|uniref:beta-glucosidase n=1 Tax=Rhynchosporium secalis TaxID=38038 RepID=A0A1E1MBX0_RHYSE|nr:related to Probable beta-glucosidase K [Rhynchosporium secalis]